MCERPFFRGERGGERTILSAKNIQSSGRILAPGADEKAVTLVLVRHFRPVIRQTEPQLRCGHYERVSGIQRDEKNSRRTVFSLHIRSDIDFGKMKRVRNRHV